MPLGLARLCFSLSLGLDACSMIWVGQIFNLRYSGSWTSWCGDPLSWSIILLTGNLTFRFCDLTHDEGSLGTFSGRAFPADKVTTFPWHHSRVGYLSWTTHFLSSWTSNSLFGVWAILAVTHKSSGFLLVAHPLDGKWLTLPRFGPFLEPARGSASCPTSSCWRMGGGEWEGGVGFGGFGSSEISSCF